MSLDYYTGFDEFPDDITLFPPSSYFRLASGNPNTLDAGFSSSGASYGYGKAFIIKRDLAAGHPPQDGLPVPLFTLGDAYDGNETVYFGFDFTPQSSVSMIGALLNASGQQIMGVILTPLGYPSLFGAYDGITGGEHLATADDPLVLNQTYYVEVAFASRNQGANAVCKVWIDNVKVIDYSGTLLSPITPSLEGDAYWRWTDFIMGASAGAATNGLFVGGQAVYDNLYQISSGGVEPITRDGRVLRVSGRWPTAEVGGQTIGYTQSGTGSSVSDFVGENSNDGDTSFYTASNLNDTVIFSSTDAIPGNPQEILAIMAEHYSKRNGASLRTLTPIVRDAGANYLGSGSSAPAAFGAMNTIWQSRPSDSTALTKTVVEALDVGVKLTG